MIITKNYNNNNIMPSHRVPQLFSDHEFDLPSTTSRKRKRKHDTVSSISAPPRGALPVRQHHKCDESKILPEKRV